LDKKPITIVDPKTSESLKTAIQDFWRDRTLALSFAKRDLRIKFARTKLGFAWLILNPIITVGIFTFVFGSLIKIPTQGLPYLCFYLVGIVNWNFFTSLVNINSAAIESYYALMSKVYFSKLSIPVGNFLVLVLEYIVGLLLVLATSLFYGLNIIFLIPSALLAVMLISFFGIGLGIGLANLSFQKRDIKMSIPLGLQLAFFATPIIYPSALLPEALQWLTAVNPIAMAIEVMRAAISGSFFSIQQVAISFAISVCTLLIGLNIFVKGSQRSLDV
jgi:lipopolysaccharide transport system permease protein